MSLVDAVEEKYMLMIDRNFPGFRISGSPGKNESGRFVIPPILIMDDRGIEKAGDEEGLQEMLQDVQELDLSKNRLSSWSEVMKLVKHCPAIVSVNLSKNSLGEDSNLPTVAIEAPIRSGFSSLQTLILNSTGVTWEQVFSLLPGLPKLNELHLGMNNMEDVAVHTENFPNIRTFYFNGNRLNSFKQVLQIGKIFPHLEQLFLIQNCLERIKEDSETAVCSNGDAKDADFNLLPHLNHLNLSQNCLTNWTCVSCLCNLPALSHLRIGSNPVFEGWSEENCRFHVIAWLPKLNYLNGSAIDGIEREKAERAFIRHFMDDAERPTRYFELEKKHGRLDPYANVDLAPKRSVNVLVQYEDSKRLHDLSTEQTVGSVKKELCSLFSVSPSSIRLLYIDQELQELTGIACPEELKSSIRGIHSYLPNDGDGFILEKK